MNKKYLSKKKVLLFPAIAALLISGALFYSYKKHNNAATLPPNSGDYINYGPPTKEEKNESNAAKQNIVEKKNSNNTTSQTKVTPVIASASKTVVNAFVPGVFEDGGTCTALFIQNDITIKRTANGFTNSNYTQCAPISPDLPNEGNWTVTIIYQSSYTAGQSNAQELQ